jgi:hypothetical protein
MREKSSQYHLAVADGSLPIVDCQLTISRGYQVPRLVKVVLSPLSNSNRQLAIAIIGSIRYREMVLT